MNVSTEMLDSVLRTEEAMKVDLAKAEKDNNTIYLQPVPPFTSLPPTEGALLVKATLPSCCSPDSPRSPQVPMFRGVRRSHTVQTREWRAWAYMPTYPGRSILPPFPPLRSPLLPLRASFPPALPSSSTVVWTSYSQNPL